MKVKIFWSKFSTLENNVPGKGHYRKYLPRVFTEQGVAMLATILKSKIATQVSIRIMDAFVEMKKYISNEILEQKYINSLDRVLRYFMLLLLWVDKYE